MSTGMNHNNASIKLISRTAQIVDPAPVSASVFLDEDEWGIQNGAIGIQPGHMPPLHWNLVASRHNYAGTIAFADGHAEAWKWKDKWIREGHEILKRRYRDNPSDADASTPSSAEDRDLKRLQLTVPF